jgi:hypothetical protein
MLQASRAYDCFTSTDRPLKPPLPHAVGQATGPLESRHPVDCNGGRATREGLADLGSRTNSNPAIVVKSQGVIPPSAVLLAEIAADPRESPLVDAEDANGPASGNQSIVDPPRAGMQIVAGMIEFARHGYQANAVTDPEVTPRFIHKEPMKAGRSTDGLTTRRVDRANDQSRDRVAPAPWARLSGSGLNFAKTTLEPKPVHVSGGCSYVPGFFIAYSVLSCAEPQPLPTTGIRKTDQPLLESRERVDCNVGTGEPILEPVHSCGLNRNPAYPP